ncbi:hypothetical protein KUCAC02_034900, partial [Chaenocephalus aceratus]
CLLQITKSTQLVQQSHQALARTLPWLAADEHPEEMDELEHRGDLSADAFTDPGVRWRPNTDHLGVVGCITSPTRHLLWGA